MLVPQGCRPKHHKLGTTDSRQVSVTGPDAGSQQPRGLQGHAPPWLQGRIRLCLAQLLGVQRSPSAVSGSTQVAPFMSLCSQAFFSGHQSLDSESPPKPVRPYLNQSHLQRPEFQIRSHPEALDLRGTPFNPRQQYFLPVK